MVKKSKSELSRIAKRAVRTRQLRSKRHKYVKAGKKGARTRKLTGGHSKENQELKREVFTAYSKKTSKSKIPCCNCCGENTSLDFLCIDHIAGRKLGKGKVDTRKGKALYSHLKRKNFPKGYQVLCWNCNTTKFVYIVCPHKRKKRK